MGSIYNKYNCNKYAFTLVLWEHERAASWVSAPGGTQVQYATGSKQSVQLATSSANESLADNAYGPTVAASSENNCESKNRGRPRRNVRPPSRWTYDIYFVGTDNV